MFNFSGNSKTALKVETKKGQDTKTDVKVNGVELSHEPDITFGSDLSFIKPSSVSFAPFDFKFEPPALLYTFDDDDEDGVEEALEKVKRKYLSRT